MKKETQEHKLPRDGSITVLVAVGNRAIRHAAVRALHEAGLAVMEAGSAGGCFDLAARYRPGLFLLDVELPDINGIEMCWRLKAEPSLKDSFVVLFAESATSTITEDEGQSVGADGIIERPIGDRELSARIKLMLRLRDARMELQEKTNALLAEQAHLYQKAEQYRTIVENLGIGVALITPEMKILELNHQMRQWFPGVDAKQEPICYEAFNNPPRNKICSYCQTCTTLRDGLTHEAYTETPQGDEIITYRIISSPILNKKGEVAAAIEMVEDVTEQKRAEKALHYQAGLLEAVSDAVISTDNDFRIASWNRAAEDMYGWRSDEVIGKAFGEIVPVEYPDTDRASVLAEFVRDGSWHGEVIQQNRSGKKLYVLASVTAIRDKDRNTVGTIAVNRDISERKLSEEALRASEEMHRVLFQASDDAIMTLAPPDWRFTSANPATLKVFGAKDEAEFFCRSFTDCSPERQPDNRLSAESAGEVIETAMREGSHLFEWTHRRIDGREFPANVLFTRMELGGEAMLQATVRDISTLRALETDLSQARKLEAVGQLAAGIAHEINTPTQFVADSVHFLKEAFEDQWGLNEKFQKAVDLLGNGPGHEKLLEEIKEAKEIADLEYIEENVPGAIDRCIDGLSRISSIVVAMKEFAHPDRTEMTPTDLNQSLQTTLTIAKNEYKYVADVETEFGSLPDVNCLVGDLNQVFLNLIVNAAHSIGDVVGDSSDRGVIRVRTKLEGDMVCIAVSDTGGGIPEAVRDRIFDPFFTTKEVGKGSGQGLAIARSIIVEKHGGSLSFDSTTGKGTTFVIRLPVNGKCGKKNRTHDTAPSRQ